MFGLDYASPGCAGSVLMVRALRGLHQPGLNREGMAGGGSGGLISADAPGTPIWVSFRKWACFLSTFWLELS
jgi:hypothetical protein